MEDTNIPINFSGSLDTKTDPKTVVAGELLRAENMVWTNPNELEKRNGYKDITNGAPVFSAIHGYGQELVGIGSGLIQSFAPTASAWQKRGVYRSVQLQKFNVDTVQPASGYSDVQVLNGYALYVWSSQNAISSGPATEVYASVVDLSTGVSIGTYNAGVNASILNTQVNPVRAVILAGTTLAVAYLKADASGVLLATVSISGGAATFTLANSGNVVTTGFTGSAFDIVGTATGAVLGYFNATPALVLTLVGSTGTAGASVAKAGTYQQPIHLKTDTSNNIWAFFVSATFTGPTVNTSLIRYTVMDSTLGTTIVAPTTIITFGTTPLFIPSNLSAYLSTSVANTMVLYYGYFTQGGQIGSTKYYTDFTSLVTANLSGSVGPPTSWAYGVFPFSRFFSDSSSNQYLMCAYRGYNAQGTAPTLQPTFFMVQAGIDTSSAAGMPTVVARFAPGQANTQAVLGSSFGNGIVTYNPNVAVLTTGSKWLFAYGAAVQEFSSDSFQSADGGLLSNNFSLTFDLAGQDINYKKECGQLLILNGGCVSAYDGNLCSELNFHVPPEITTQPKTTGGSMADATYSYLAIFAWYDGKGNLHRSAPSIVASAVVSGGGGSGSVALTVTNPYLSQKTGAFVEIYRTNGTGNSVQYYLVTDPIFTLNAIPGVGLTNGAAIVTYTDKLADASIIGNPIAYTYPGSPVLENGAPPASMALESHNNRLWMIDLETGNEAYTKKFQPGTGLSPSPLLLNVIDPKLGVPYTVAEMDEKLVTLTAKGLFVQAGDGVDATGANLTLTDPQPIPSDVGCDQLKAVLTTPAGVIFKSPNGFYLLDRGLGVTYVGAKVEAYNAQTFTSITFVPGVSQVRILTSSGLSLVWDYLFQKWGTFTGHQGPSSTIFQKLYTYVSGSVGIWQENPGNYLDNATPFAALIETAWLNVAGVSGLQRIKKLAMLGQYANGASAAHKIQIQEATDYGTYATAVPFSFGAINTNGVFQYRERLITQKCSVMSLIISEVTTGDSAEFMSLGNMSFSGVVKRGLGKFPTTKLVG